jgi:hypothetical protein
MLFASEEVRIKKCYMLLSAPKFIEVCYLYAPSPFLTCYDAKTTSSWTTSCKESICRVLGKFGVDAIVGIYMFDLIG